MSDFRSHPDYAVGYEHGLAAHTPFIIEGDEYQAGHSAGRAAPQAFLNAGMTPDGNGGFVKSVAIKGLP